MSSLEVEDFLEHYGVKGMKWGQRKAPSKLSSSKSDSSVTRRTKKEYNSLSDKEFFQKHGTTKARYAKRVKKYGDPYMKSPLAKTGKKLDASKFGEAAKANVSRSEARAKNRQLNRASRARDKADKKNKVAAKEKHQKDVDAARAAVKSGQTKAEFKATKAQAKALKAEIGSREARKITRGARNVKYETISKSREIRDGKELTKAILMDLALGTNTTANARTWHDTYNDMYNK